VEISLEIVAIVGGPGGPAGDVAQGLRSLGATVTELPAGTRAELAAGLRAAGPVKLVVWAPAPGAAASPSPLVDHDEAAWDAEAAEPLRQAVACFQAAQDVMAEEGGALVAVIPTFAMAGSAGFTAWTTAAEGLRSLVKVAARDLGKQNISVNAIALPAQALAGSAQSLNRPGLPAPVFTPPADAGEAAGIIAALAAPPWRAVTGATIALDGGVWAPA
jgi:NAD(P)-dependent dehydrogenase (short-subunit alcohol dehydrogenase family)